MIRVGDYVKVLLDFWDYGTLVHPKDSVGKVVEIKNGALDLNWLFKDKLYVVKVSGCQLGYWERKEIKKISKKKAIIEVL